MKKSKTAEYTADSIRLITDNIEKVRTSMSMYTKYGNRGFLHLIREVLNNAADEASGLFANHIKVFYDENTKKVIISDNGRGIPIEALHMVFTELHKSGKKDKGSEDSAYEFTSGTNGVGVTVVNALSEYLKCRVRTGGQQAVIEFRFGVQKDLKISDYKAKDTGTEVEFVPLEYLDEREMLGPVNLPASEVYDLTKDLGYLTPKGVITELEIVPLGKSKVEKHVFKNDNGVKDLLPYVVNVKRNLIPDLVFTDYREELLPVGNGKTIKDAMDYEVAITYNLEHERSYQSFANYCNTSDGGSHIKAIEDAVAYVLTKKTKDAMSDAEKKRIDIKPQDTRNGLVVAVHARCKITDKSFEGQTKERFTNDRVYKFMRSSVTRQLFDYLEKDKKTEATLIKLTKDMARARLNAQKEKDVIIKSSNNFFRDDTGKLVRAEGNGYKEIIIVEGDSAGGSLKNKRDNLRQAIYPLKGVPLNAFTKSFNESMTNAELRAFCTALGCGGGKTFKLENLKYDKIIIMTDADADGGKIRSLLCAFFIKHMPELITSGKVFVAVSPLYGWKDKNGKSRYFIDNFEYVDFLIEMSANANEIKIGGNTLNKKEVKSLLLRNKTYLNTLEEVANQLVIHPDILEYVAYYLDRNMKEFKKVIKSKFPYMEITEGEDGTILLDGLYKDEFYALIINDYTIEKLDKVAHLINTVNFGNIFVELNGSVVTLYKMLQEFKKNEPKNMRRYKGLGEMNADELWDTTTNPETRKLYQLTAKDVMREMMIFDQLHGKDADSRKELLSMVELDPDMIDN